MVSFEKIGNAHTAEELFQFLSNIPQQIREVLPIEVILTEDKDDDGTVDLYALEGREEGNFVRVFQIAGIE